MSGDWGYRGLGRFVERHRRQLIDTLKIPGARVPSYSTIRRVMIQVDYQALTQVFNQWASQYTHHHHGQWIAIDGKSLKNTVSDCCGREQNFIMMVSAFSHHRGEILGIKVMENKNKAKSRQYKIDVVTQEDNSPQLRGQASTNISLIKSWVLSLLRVHGFDSITEALDYMSNNLPLLLSFCH
ncbi:MAG: transposase family protein [Hydrococcus sp. SU_1_0]|nr:transposase family protein [Hydrococcus sp. SU_1_0]